MLENTYNIKTRSVRSFDDGESLTEVLNQIIAENKAILAGDLILSVSPATLGSSAAAVNAAIGGSAGKFTRDVTIKLVDSDGTLIKSNGSFTIGVAETTAGDGVAAIEDSATSVDLSNGEATVTLEYTGTWAENDTCTFTATGGTVAGASVSNKTSVDTLVA